MILRFVSNRLLGVLSLFTFSCSALAADASLATQADVDAIWIVVAGALVFFMQAGFALLESGLSRAKNSVNVIMKNYADLCVGSIAFSLLGFGLMFGDNATGWWGSTHFLMSDLQSASEYSFLFFQIMFAATAATIASGAMAERTQFLGYLLGAIGICAIIYPVYGSWVWGSFYSGSGWLAELGFIDFAGSTVVHSVGGWCALAAIIVLGPRLGRFGTGGNAREIPGHNLNYMALGGFILWLGWFGFNAGSTVAATADVGLIALNTHLSAASGVIAVVCGSFLFGRPILSRNAINGGVAGLVAITAGCATMTPWHAVITGLIGGLVLLAGDKLLEHFGLDDVVGAVAAHGFAGAWGTLAAGIFFVDDPYNFIIIGTQMIGVIAAFVWVFPTALVMYLLIHYTVGLRASTEDERRGLDYTEHSELGYPEFQQQTLNQMREQ
ncbi:ammonium transporter [gamma proteobacterium HTCC5015]|nr:ammonium transporter [gamma proteobacterium HTCC5015]